MVDVLVSIIIAAYNVENYISNCIESILRQTYTNFELIIVDDGSVDRTGAICDEYANIDKRIMIVHQANMGVSAARNAGLKHISGRYVTFIDSDDEVSFKYLENLLLPCINDKADISVCLYQYLSKEDKYNPSITNNYEVVDIDYQILQAKIIGRCCGSLIDKSLLDNVYFNTDLYVGEDLLFLCNAINNAKTIAITSDKLYCYYIYDESSYNGAYDEKKFTEIISWNRVINLFKDRPAVFKNTIYRLYGWILLNNILRMEKDNYTDKAKKKYCLHQLRKMTKYVFNRYPGGGKRNIAMYPVYLIVCISPPLGYFVFNMLMRWKHCLQRMISIT